MSVLRLIFNIAWFIMGGFVMGLAWWLAGLLCFISIVGIPFGRACFVIGEMAFWPFGQENVNRKHLSGIEDFGTGPLGMVGNVIWFLFCGIWLAIGHLTHALACFVTIIGIPFAIQHVKLALLSLTPIGQTIVAKESY
ncbi:YccF domain-containing protein [Shewanella sp. 1_MG-2023]|uniref:Inner membrane protein YccF n=1 Tax=Shewanella electrodiphila TaxID=934143 RepID=A0ABT0KQA3_9GAMM|nr:MULTISPECIES: YccF domain-containing protein [Shewanella]MCC4832351.1 YccF domain-containing protein [Shewanella sp. 10N.7]MCL1045849.1 YccF domain-containing protein [Shewanella electrodiphila]MDO6610874.1 YccF domain-containing protein [Shewanella sp. 7_MG-2023]MDO6770275.1 YccF domain-containing protein [Shewanella sp. 2_MG-2023]MDO6793416.1 YccF domain-containing protein [Shewanella sp. 1_MG-2023]